MVGRTGESRDAVGKGRHCDRNDWFGLNEHGRRWSGHSNRNVDMMMRSGVVRNSRIIHIVRSDTCSTRSNE